MNETHVAIIVSSFVPTPGVEYNLVVGRPVENPIKPGETIVLLTGKVNEKFVYPMGVLSKIEKCVPLPDNCFKCRVKAIERFEVTDVDIQAEMATGHKIASTLDKEIADKKLRRIFRVALAKWDPRFETTQDSENEGSMLSRLDGTLTQDQFANEIALFLGGPLRKSGKAGYKMRPGDFDDTELNEFNKSISQRIESLKVVEPRPRLELMLKILEQEADF